MRPARNNDTHGDALCVFPDGTTYRGETKDGWPHGQGKFASPSGDLYEGGMKMKTGREGHGKQTYAIGGYYEGQWHHDQRHGHGKVLDPNGNIYEGQWRSNMKHGHGNYTLIDKGPKQVFEGEFKHDMMHGWGRLEWPDDGSVATGQWHKDMKHGQMRFEFSDGVCAIRQYNEDVAVGEGVYFWHEEKVTMEETVKDGKTVTDVINSSNLMGVSKKLEEVFQQRAVEQRAIELKKKHEEEAREEARARTLVKVEEEVRARRKAKEEAWTRLKAEEERLMVKKREEVAAEKLRMKAVRARKERLDKAEQTAARAAKELSDAEARVQRARNAEIKTKMENQRDCKMMARDNANDLLEQVRRDIAHETAHNGV